MYAGFTSGHKTFLSEDIQGILLYFICKIDSIIFQPVHLICPFWMNSHIFCCYPFCLPANLEIDESCACCHETAYPRWHICVSGSPLAGLLAGIPVPLKVTLFTPCLFPLPLRSLAEPAGWASPSAFSLVPLIFLFTILLLILEFTFFSKCFIGLLEFLTFLWQEIWASR